MTNIPTVSGVVLARDSADVIDDCLRSLAWTDEIVVVLDAATRDDTEQRARTWGARVETRPFLTFADQRNAALALARSDWVFFVDSDERVPTLLADEVRNSLDSNQEFDGYWVPRKNIICGRWIQTAGWFPDYQLRLLRRSAARYDTRLPVHEVAELIGETAQLQEPLVHFNYRTLAEFWRKQRRYAQLAARGLVLRGEKPRGRSIIGQPLHEFHRRYVTQKGYRDGALGFALCVILAIGAGEAHARAVFSESSPSAT